MIDRYAENAIPSEKLVGYATRDLTETEKIARGIGPKADISSYIGTQRGELIRLSEIYGLARRSQPWELLAAGVYKDVKALEETINELTKDINAERMKEMIYRLSID